MILCCPNKTAVIQGWSPVLTKAGVSGSEGPYSTSNDPASWPRPEAMKTAALTDVETHVKFLEKKRGLLEACWDLLFNLYL